MKKLLPYILMISLLCGVTGCQEEKPAVEKFPLSVLKSCGVITDGIGHGSVVAVAPNILLTAGHCIGMPGCWVEINGVKYEILDEWVDDEYDVGFVRIDGEVPPVIMGPTPEILDEVYLVGSPYDRDFINTITKGIVSALDRDYYDWVDVIQTDSEGAPGSSGGPLFNERGGLIGICVAGPNPGGGVTLCEPVDHIRQAFNRFAHGDDPI